MAAAMVGDRVGISLEEGSVPKHLQKFGGTREELFLELGEVSGLYGKVQIKFHQVLSGPIPT